MNNKKIADEILALIKQYALKDPAFIFEPDHDTKLLIYQLAEKIPANHPSRNRIMAELKTYEPMLNIRGIVADIWLSLPAYDDDPSLSDFLNALKSILLKRTW